MLVLHALLGSGLLLLSPWSLQLAEATPSIAANEGGVILHVDDAQSVTVQVGGGNQFSVVTSETMGSLDALLASADDGPDSTVAQLITSLLERADAAEKRLAALETGAANGMTRLAACEERVALAEGRATKLEASDKVTADVLETISETLKGKFLYQPLCIVCMCVWVGGRDA